MVATYQGQEVVILKSTAFIKNGGCLKINAHRIDDFIPDGIPPIENPICFEELVFSNELEKNRVRRELISYLRPKKIRKKSRKTDCNK